MALYEKSTIGYVSDDENEKEKTQKIQLTDTEITKEEFEVQSKNTDDTNIVDTEFEINDTNDKTFERDTKSDECEPCLHRKITIPATQYCKECDEKYCQQCAFSHTTQKQTKTHNIIDIVKETTPSLNCEPCSYKGKVAEALYRCENCDERLCEDCKSFHIAQKSNKDHAISEIKTETDRVNCETCIARGCDDNAATVYCLDCEEPEAFCDFCAEQHKSMKVSRNHKLSSDLQMYISRMYIKDLKHGTVGGVFQEKSRAVNITEVTESETPSPIRPVLLCEPCAFQDMNETATHYCLTCDERYCARCTKRHRSHKRTRDHELLDLARLKRMCDPCEYNEEDREATHLCVECDEGLCVECMKYHRSEKQTKDHRLNLVQNETLCESCKENKENVPASSYCLDCDEHELFCDPCAKHHISLKQTRNHRMSHQLDELLLLILKKKYEQRLSGILQELEVDNKGDKYQPGKPYCTENKSNHITLKWDSVKLGENDFYQLMYREGTTDKWKTSTYNPSSSTLHLDGLKPTTSYVFRVRVFNDVSLKEGPFSLDSDVITTGESQAMGMMRKSKLLRENPIAVYALPAVEIRGSRNSHAEIKKMTLGNHVHNPTEKNVMIVGATGSGKSTLINAMANYIMGVTWEDPFRFSLVNVEQSEMVRAGDQAHSQTKWITCYSIYQSVSNRLQYTLNLIDTPGFGDTKGLDQDRRNVEQLRALFTTKGVEGISTINAVCFILKAPDARLTPTQMYIFEEILSLFGNDIKENICTLITFADGQTPPVLACLEALEHNIVPYERYFTFNNSALFTANTLHDSNSLPPKFWEMGMKSCEEFFDHLSTLKMKSLVLTSEVLIERERLEITIQHLYQEVEYGLSKVNVLEQEIEIFTKYRQQIRENKNFTYSVEENVQEIIDLTGTHQYTTNCLSCNFTCHRNCSRSDDEDKRKCCVMEKDGNCRVCPSNCHWTQHKNTPFIITWVPQLVQKHYSEKQKIYEEASENSLTQEQILEEMNKDIEVLENAIADRLQQITQSNNRLKEIALRPDPCSTAQYIDLMVESEKREKKNGFEKRIDALEKCKKKVQYGQSLKIFQDRMQSTRDNLHATVLRDEDLGTQNKLITAVKKFGKRVIFAIKT